LTKIYPRTSFVARAFPLLASFLFAKLGDYAYFHNLQGDILGLFDMSGAQVVQYTYDARGKLTSTEGNMAGTLGSDNPFRYRGYVYDEETGLYYLRSRYYNPEWGRFINADTVLGNVGGLLSHNGFAYCGNNPVVRADPLGKSLVWVVGQPWFMEVAEKALQVVAGIASAVVGLILGDSISRNSGSQRTFIQPETISGELGEIASVFPTFECEKAMRAMGFHLMKSGQKFTVIEIIDPMYPGIIWSDTVNRSISENGYHVGVKFLGLVHCNVHPLGLPEEQWLNDFHGPGELFRIVLRTPVYPTDWGLGY